jgi:hypothetical protein
MNRPWHMVVANLADLYEYLERNCCGPDPYEFLSNPQNWEAEWAEMLREEERDAA